MRTSFIVGQLAKDFDVAASEATAAVHDAACDSDKNDNPGTPLLDRKVFNGWGTLLKVHIACWEKEPKYNFSKVCPILVIMYARTVDCRLQWNGVLVQGY